MFRKIALLLILFSSITFAQTPDRFSWDYADADISSAGIDRFEVQYDGGNWTSVGLPPAVVDGNTLPGMKSYRSDYAPLTPGPHKVAVRACNPSTCSDPTAPMDFTLIVKPKTVSNLRNLPG